MIEAGGVAYFVASDTLHGRELWRLDANDQMQLVADFVNKRGGGFGMIAGPAYSPVAKTCSSDSRTTKRNAPKPRRALASEPNPGHPP